MQAENKRVPAMRLSDTSQFNEEINAIGDMHNSSLAVAFPSMPYCSPTTYDDGLVVFGDILTSNYLASDDYADAQALIDRCSTLAATKSEIAILKAAANNSDYADAYNAIEDAANAATSAASFDSVVVAIYHAEVELNPSGEVVLKRMCGIAIGSYDYWDANINDWIALHDPNPDPNPGNSAKTDKEKVVEFVMGDLAGSIGGPALSFLCSGLVAWSWD